MKYLKNILFYLCLSSISLLFFGLTAFSVRNKHTIELIRYHDSGQYSQDISNTIKEATYYLKFRITQNNRIHPSRKLAIVMDIDETALSNYDKLLQYDFHISEKILHKIALEADNTAILHTLALYNYAREHGVAIFFISQRPSTLLETTIQNLKQAGFKDWSGLAFNTKNGEGEKIQFYIRTRQNIIARGYDIVINLGSHNNTLVGGYADMQFKLPNPFYD